MLDRIYTNFKEVRDIKEKIKYDPLTIPCHSHLCSKTDNEFRKNVTGQKLLENLTIVVYCLNRRYIIVLKAN